MGVSLIPAIRVPMFMAGFCTSPAEESKSNSLFLTQMRLLATLVTICLSSHRARMSTTPGYRLTLTVKSLDGEEPLKVKLEPTTNVTNIMQAYTDFVGKEAGLIRFLHDGKRLKPGKTALELKLQDEDTIYATCKVCM